MGIGSFVPGELEAGPVNQIRFLVFAWEMVNTHLFFFFARPAGRISGDGPSSGAGLVRANGALTYRLVMVR